MNMIKTLLLGSVALFGASQAFAEDLEVMHWWTSGGEAAAVAELAKAFDASGNHWVDGAIAGSGDTARPIMVSRLTGGDPMGAFQFNHGRQAEELIQAGLLRNLDAVAEANKWREVINPPSLLDACTVEGHIYCAPMNISSWQWLWMSNAAFEKAGVPIPKTWDEFVAAGPALKAAGIIPLAMGQQGWQQSGAFNILFSTLLPDDVYLAVYQQKDAKVAAGPEVAKVFKAAADARALSKDSTVQDWNQATNLVITGQAGGQLMGDWAQGEFQVAGKVAGKDYTCLPGLGVKDVLLTGGDAFYFPVLQDEAKTKAQDVLAKLLVSPEVQVAFNLKKGSLPIRADIDMNAANDCMKKGLKILAGGHTLPDSNLTFTQDTVGQLKDLFVQFFSDATMTPEAAQEKFAAIIADAK